MISIEVRQRYRGVKTGQCKPLGSQLKRSLKALFHEPSSLNDHFLSVAITKPGRPSHNRERDLASATAAPFEDAPGMARSNGWATASPDSLCLSDPE